MIVGDTASLKLARSHIDADPATAHGLLRYHVREREIAGFHSTETAHHALAAHRVDSFPRRCRDFALPLVAIDKNL